MELRQRALQALQTSDPQEKVDQSIAIWSQFASFSIADDGIPEPKPGLVTEAHGGILFIDEIGELDPMLLNKLLKVLEDKRVSFESAY